MSNALTTATKEAKNKYLRRTMLDKDTVHGSELLVRFTHRKRETIKARSNIKSVVKDN